MRRLKAEIVGVEELTTEMNKIAGGCSIERLRFLWTVYSFSPATEGGGYFFTQYQKCVKFREEQQNLNNTK